MTQDSVAAERLRFILAFSLNSVSTGSPPAGAGGRCRCVLASSTSGPASFGSGLHVYIFIYHLGVAHFSMLKALKILIFSYSLFCVLILIPP